MMAPVVTVNMMMMLRRRAEHEGMWDAVCVTRPEKNEKQI